MLELTVEQISMGQVAVDKSAALHLLAEKLVADGLVAEGYLSGLQAREAQGSTFLGQGIAIPTALPKRAIRCSPPVCACCSFPKGVDWGTARSCTWPSALPPNPTNTCACCNCSPAPSVKPTWARLCAVPVAPKRC